MITITIYDIQWFYTFFYFLAVSIIFIILITSLYLPATFNWRLWWQNGNSPFWSTKIYIIWCGFRKGNGFLYIFFHGYEWTIINLPKLQYKTEHLAKYQLNIFCFYYKVWPTYASLSQYRRNILAKHVCTGLYVVKFNYMFDRSASIQDGQCYWKQKCHGMSIYSIYFTQEWLTFKL